MRTLPTCNTYRGNALADIVLVVLRLGHGETSDSPPAPPLARGNNERRVEPERCDT